MKVDCSITKNYFKEKSRMTKGCSIGCAKCPMLEKNRSGLIGLMCDELELEFPEYAIKNVQEWSDKHQQKTRRTRR